MYFIFRGDFLDLEFNGFKDYKRLGGRLDEDSYGVVVGVLKDYDLPLWSGFYRSVALKSALVNQGFDSYIVEWNVPNEILKASAMLLNKLYDPNSLSKYRRIVGIKNPYSYLEYFDRGDLSVIVDEAFAMTANENNMFNPTWLKFQYEIWKRL